MLLLTCSFLFVAMCYLRCKSFPFFIISSTNFLALSSKPITISPHPASPAGSKLRLTPTLVHNTTLCALSHSQALTSKVRSQMHLLTKDLHPPRPEAHNKTEPYLAVLASVCRGPSKGGCHALDSALRCCQGVAGSLLPAAELTSACLKCLCNCSLVFNR